MSVSDFEWKDGPWRRILAAVNDLDDSYVKVGVLAETGDSEHGEGESGDITILELAAIHEFGSPAAGVPERSFIRRTFQNSEDWLPQFQSKLAKAVIQGKISHERALEILGKKCVDEVKNTITEGEGVPPPLEQSTIDAKGSSRPLVDTGQLVNSISYEVVMGGDV